jgi:hypothetical protein
MLLKIGQKKKNLKSRTSNKRAIIFNIFEDRQVANMINTSYDSKLLNTGNKYRKAETIKRSSVPQTGRLLGDQ